VKVTVAVGVVETDLVGVEENVALGGIVVVLIVGMGFVREGVGVDVLVEEGVAEGEGVPVLMVGSGINWVEVKVDVRIKVLVLVGELVNVAVL